MQATLLHQPTLLLPDWPGQPAQQIVNARIRSRVLPSTPGVTTSLQGPAIIALAADDALSRALAEKLSVRWNELSEGAFAILPQQKRLLVLGGDKRGLLSGLTTLLDEARIQGDSIEWSGGERWERPALPRNYYWTWDHSTNWWLQSEGQQETGCNNLYTKSADDFVRDYKLLVDHCVRTRVGGIVIWGFVRDAHGGVAASQEVCNYAADRGVRILPGVGTSVYGGVYYVSDQAADAATHPLTAKSFVRDHPQAGMIEQDDKVSTLYPCPTHPATIAWLKECAAWLFGTFRIGGVNLEHGDFVVCHCERCSTARRGQRQAAYFSTMQLANQPFMDEALRLRPDAWITYATYTGFAPDPTPETGFMPAKDWGSQEAWRIHGENPEFVRDLDARSICQWTLTQMVHEKQLPLASWLEDGSPAAMSRSDHWPAGHKPPTHRSVGFVHQGSQWDSRGSYPDGSLGRYSVQISCIKEACLRAAKTGLEGVSIHGEISTRCIPYALNYLAFTHFSYHPEASLREFGRAMLGPILGSAADGERFVEWLAKAEAGGCSPDELKQLDKHVADSLRTVAAQGAGLTPARCWRWLRIAAVPGQWASAQVYQVGA
jgi:hypothetical protein